MDCDLLLSIVTMDLLKIILGSLFGSAAGAAVIVCIDHILQNKQKIKDNFQEAVSIQLSVNMMLNIILQLYIDYTDKKERFSGVYSKEIWEKFKFIDFRTLEIGHPFINLNWDFKQFLSEETQKRKYLEHLITARECYQKINEILIFRNSIFDKVHELLEKYKKDNNSKNNFEYENDNISKIVGEKFKIELESATTIYVNLLEPTIESLHTAFIELSKYITNSFKGYKPLILSIPADEMKSALNEVIKI